ncbi:MAG: branched-chain-amino-acid transaminase [Clostridia bacterium]|nr:MAG: branched-chain-amino-acid transaminase [Clostridia bacterium]
MGLIIYLDGEYVPEERAKVSVFDHGLLYGDGVFEGIRAYNGLAFRLKEHLERLYASAKHIALEIPLPMAAMEEVVLETVRRNDLRDAYIRLVVSRGKGDLGLDPRKCPRATVFCIAAAIELYPAELYDRGLEMVTVATRRNVSEAVNPRVKSLNYLNNILAKIEANLAGVGEGLILNHEGYVVEATGDNVFIVKEGALITPPPYLGLLEGVTRNAVIGLARRRGIEVREEVFTRYEIYNADECLLTGTAAEVIPVVRLDGRPIGSGHPGEMSKTLIADFHRLTRTEGVPVYQEVTPGEENVSCQASR